MKTLMIIHIWMLLLVFSLHMLDDLDFLCSRVVTQLTMERFFSGMCAHMTSILMIIHIWMLLLVFSLHMLDDLDFLCGRVVTQLTMERFFSGMCAHMTSDIISMLDPNSTVWAMIWLIITTYIAWWEWCLSSSRLMLIFLKILLLLHVLTLIPFQLLIQYIHYILILLICFCAIVSGIIDVWGAVHYKCIPNSLTKKKRSVCVSCLLMKNSISFFYNQ